MVGSSAPENNPIVLGLAIIFLVAFVLWEIKTRWPVVEIALFKRFTFSASALMSMFVGAALIIAMADIPAADWDACANPAPGPGQGG